MNFQPRGISEQGLQGPASYQSEIESAEALLKTKDTWNGITAEAVARMRLQNRFKTGLDIARYTAALMRADMDEIKVTPSQPEATGTVTLAAGTYPFKCSFDGHTAAGMVGKIVVG